MDASDNENTTGMNLEIHHQDRHLVQDIRAREPEVTLMGERYSVDVHGQTSGESRRVMTRDTSGIHRESESRRVKTHLLSGMQRESESRRVKTHLSSGMQRESESRRVKTHLSSGMQRESESRRVKTHLSSGVQRENESRRVTTHFSSGNHREGESDQVETRPSPSTRREGESRRGNTGEMTECYRESIHRFETSRSSNRRSVSHRRVLQTPNRLDHRRNGESAVNSRSNNEQQYRRSCSQSQIAAAAINYSQRSRSNSRQRRRYSSRSRSPEIGLHNESRNIPTLHHRPISHKANNGMHSHTSYCVRENYASNSLKRNRHRSASGSPPTHKIRESNTNEILDKFLHILDSMKGSSSKLSLNNVVPEFDPMKKDQTILTWLTKVEECSSIYGWNERETIHFALPKLVGVAKSWYQGLDTVMLSWNMWKKKLIESFPCREDYAELLTEMLAKRVRYGESLEQYYYDKMNLLNRSSIKGRKAVDCLLHGVEDRAVRVGAQAARFQEPEDVLRYFKTVKVANVKDSDKTRQDRRITSNKYRTGQTKRVFKCYNCDTDGHRSFECPKPANKCSKCNKVGHLDIHCRALFTQKTSRNYSQNTIDNTNKHTQDRHGTYLRDEKQIASLTTSDKVNRKYIIQVELNGLSMECYVDLGSQCTLIREQISNELNLVVTTNDLPVMQGVGGDCFVPLGRCYGEIKVQGIKESMILSKIILRVQMETNVPPHSTRVIPVVTTPEYAGKVLVNGSIRGLSGEEHYLLPGEYSLEAGIGRLLIHNVSNKNLIVDHNSILTRAIPVSHKYDIYSMTFAEFKSDEKVLCGTQITIKEKLALQNLLSKYSDCFSTGLKDLGFTTAGEMTIELNDSEPVVYRPYRLSWGERDQVRNMVQEMMDAGIVRETSSPYASPIVLVQKKTGEKRLCIDYRALNRRTKKDHYPLPRIEDQLDQLAGSKMFISLDLASGYYQIPIAEASQEKTAFVTPDGQYQFTRMPFGLVNAPSVFQRTMNKILADAKIKYALIYMDDFLIPATSFEQGLDRLEEVLALIKRGGLTLKLSKCRFFFDRIDFLGFEVGADGIKPGSKKTEAVDKFPAPRNVHELRQFVGLASFFRRFVKGFALIARPLTDLLKKNSEWKWDAPQEEAFGKLKANLVQRPVLTLYDPKRETQVHTDACKNGVGGVLVQKNDEGLFKPVAYYSRKTTTEEQRLHSFELETLAVVASLARFRVYLVGIPFKVLTDCNALRTTMTKRDLIPRIARWWIQLQEFDCEIEYRAGSAMQHADALSRNPVGEPENDIHILDVLNTNIDDWIATVQSNDEEICRIKDVLGNSESAEVADILKNYKVKNDKVFRITGSSGSDLRWVVPKGVRWQILKMNHDDLGHFGFDKTLARIQETFWFPKMRRFVKKYVRACLQCAHHKGTTGRQEGELHPIPKIEIPFHTIHVDHLGPFVRSSRGNSYLLVIVDGFTKYVNIKPVRNTKTSTTTKVIQEHMSYFGTPTRLISDRGTSFTSSAFQTFCKSNGVKHILNAVSTPRANGQVERFNRSILEALSTKCSDKNDKHWDEYIYSIQLGLNTTVHKTTGKSPSELLFGFKINSGSENILSDVIIETINKKSAEDLEDIRSDASKNIENQQRKEKEKFDSKRKASTVYSVGDLVSIRRDVPSDGQSMKLAMKFQGPYRIRKILPNERFVVEDTPLTKSKGHRHYNNVVAVDRIKPWLHFDNNFGSSSESEPEVVN
ncbi:uncharacterized protein LOC131849440 [Achroia grisella]|uniref:uncharacterized protein LOC131849440 n=1 Tax=Achroia grisella TaxID=688607 RepID=UPI0027D2A6A6|nr:uncharacterized protein LOC131849440 [Achroia grisella]